MLARQVIIEEGAGLVGELGERIREGLCRASFDGAGDLFTQPIHCCKDSAQQQGPINHLREHLCEGSPPKQSKGTVC